MYSTMPKIDLDKLRPVLTESEFAIARRIISQQGKNKGLLRASKPPVTKADPLSGMAAYVWRMVAFMISPVGQHQCMPVTADWDLPIESPSRKSFDDSDRWYAELSRAHDARRDLAKELDKLVDKIVDSIPKNEWHGVKRWGYALGALDRPAGEL